MEAVSLDIQKILFNDELNAYTVSGRKKYTNIEPSILNLYTTKNDDDVIRIIRAFVNTSLRKKKIANLNDFFYFEQYTSLEKFRNIIIDAIDRTVSRNVNLCNNKEYYIKLYQRLFNVNDSASFIEDMQNNMEYFFKHYDACMFPIDYF